MYLLSILIYLPVALLELVLPKLLQISVVLDSFVIGHMVPVGKITLSSSHTTEVGAAFEILEVVLIVDVALRVYK